MSGLASIGVLGVLAVLGGTIVILVCFVPYVAWSYRRHGTVPPGRAVLLAATAVYAVGLWTYTVLPLPVDPSAACTGYAAIPQLQPLQLVQDVRSDAAAGVLQNRALLQVVLNVVLFVPLGALVRALGGWSVARVLAVGFGVSLLVEVTQLTGNWGLYPCPYRLFDVDDLLTNSLGTGAGALAAPVLRRLARRPPDRPTEAPTAVTAGRRLLGMVADVVAVEVLGVVAWGAWVLLYSATVPDQIVDLPSWQQALVAGALPAVLLLLLVPWAAGGATVGQLATAVRPLRLDGAPPTPRQVLVRFSTGSGCYFLLHALDDLADGGPLGSLARLLGLLSVLVAWRSTGHRGLSGLAAGVVFVDARSDPADVGRTLEHGSGWDLRRMGMAVLSLALAVYVALALLAALTQGSTAAGAVSLLLLVALLAGLTVTMAVFLVVNGLHIARRERRSLGNLLSLLTGLATVALLVASVPALLLGPRWAVTAAVSALALFGYVAFLLLAFVGYGLLYGRLAPTSGVDAVIVLGSRLVGSRVPPLLASRLDRAMTVFGEERARGHTPLVICSGGRGPDEEVAEATAMAGYLRDRGLPGDAVVEEDASRSTEQNMTLSWALVQARGGHRVVVVTNDFHVFRAALIARELGVPAQVVGSPTARYFFPSAVLREFVGVLARRRLTYALTGALIAMSAGAATWLALAG